jgi:hypothetical protein
VDPVATRRVLLESDLLTGRREPRGCIAILVIRPRMPNLDGGVLKRIMFWMRDLRRSRRQPGKLWWNWGRDKKGIISLTVLELFVLLIQYKVYIALHNLDMGIALEVRCLFILIYIFQEVLYLAKEVSKCEYRLVLRTPHLTSFLFPGPHQAAPPKEDSNDMLASS